MPGELKPFLLPKAAREAMASRAVADYPEETCGLVFARGEDLEVLPMENIQNRLHREFPGVYTVNARRAYCMDSMKLDQTIEERLKAGQSLRAIYHSHPDEASYFSPTDNEAAAPLGEPMYPGVLQLVFSVRKGRVVDLKAFDWLEKDGKYVEVPITDAVTP